MAIVPMTYAVDLLDEAVEPSKQNNQILDIWNNRNAVGNTVFKQSTGLDGNVQQPLYVRVIKFILRATLVLGVTMWLLVGVRYIFAQGDEKEEQKLMWYIWNILYGILLALAALAIVELILSITRSSVNL